MQAVTTKADESGRVYLRNQKLFTTGDVMDNEAQDKIIQVNFANEQRNAARDFCEVHTQSNLKYVMAVWPQARLDEQAIENCRFFKARFGFEATKEARSDVIAFQQRFGFYDSQIAMLKRSSFIRVDRHGVRVDKSLLVPVLGWMQIAMLSGVILMLGSMVAYSNSPEWKQAVGYMILGVVSFMTLMWVLKSCVLPRGLLKEYGVLSDHGDLTAAHVGEPSE